jgi:hypothetical protein
MQQQQQNMGYNGLNLGTTPIQVVPFPGQGIGNGGSSPKSRDYERDMF